ncbi:MAG: M23 family metallopeptidase, partial [Actinomycetota bacterium]
LKARQARLEGRLREAMKAEESRKRAAAAKLKASRTVSESQRRSLEAAAKGVRLTGGGKFGSFALPIAGPAGFADTWGAARDGGRRHQGTDVMAPCGAPVVAVTSGTITRTMSGGAGGIMAYLRANNGDVFFYAHLQGFSDGTAAGRRVSTGDLIARNGNTGNARGGPCHVHFEWHPGGGRPVNPYSLLASAR